MDEQQVRRAVEAVLFVAGEPVAARRLAEVISEVEPSQLTQAIQALNEEYQLTKRAFRIQEVAGGYQLVTDQELALWVRRALSHPKPDSVTKSTLETLAIIAYKQPMTKAEIEAIRGVDVTASLDTLVERRFVRVAGRKETPGRPYLYGTTTEFLRHFGLKSIEALPPMAQPALVEPESAEESAAVDATAPAGSAEGASSDPVQSAASGEGAVEASAAPDA